MNDARAAARERRPPMRLVTYNVRRCLGIDGTLSCARVADVLAACDADVIALQELDVGRVRSGGADQAEAIARRLGVKELFFHPAWRNENEHYGDAILTRLPAKLFHAGVLPTAGLTRREPRGALWAQVDTGSGTLHVVNTHFGLGPRERMAQALAMLGPEWLGQLDPADPAILLGDLNSMPGGRVYRKLASNLTDVPAQLGRAGPTFPTGRPLIRIDHVFATRGVEPREAEVIATPLARVASDHLPLAVAIDVPEATGASA